MKTTKRFLLVAIAVASLAATGTWTAEPSVQVSSTGFAEQLSNAYAEIADRLEPSVVSIEVIERVRLARGFRGPDSVRETEGVGSGFIVDAAGYVLTNRHVVDGADEIVIRLHDGSVLDATVVATDVETDLAVLEVDAGVALTPIRFGDSDAMGPGHLVLALGSPFGFENSVSAGIVSAKNRSIPGGATFQRFIQTDAAIYPGNSGGPLVNMAGEVIGVNTAVMVTGRSTSGVGFALPSNTAQVVYAQLVAGGRVVRGSIGVTFNADLVQGGGVRVTSIVAGGPADRAGIRAGDVIVAVAGEDIADSDRLLDIVAGQAVGTSVPVGIDRNGRELGLDVEIVDRDQLYSQRAGTRRFR